MQPRLKPSLTPAEYLRLERQAETKSEYWDGQVYAMAGASEVFSPSMAACDRGARFEFFRMLESLSDYLLVAQDRPFIEHFVCQPDDKWLLSTYRGPEAVAPIASIGCDLRLADVYDKVEWPETPDVLRTLRLVKEPGIEWSYRERPSFPGPTGGAGAG